MAAKPVSVPTSRLVPVRSQASAVTCPWPGWHDRQDARGADIGQHHQPVREAAGDQLVQRMGRPPACTTRRRRRRVPSAACPSGRRRRTAIAPSRPRRWWPATCRPWSSSTTRSWTGSRSSACADHRAAASHAARSPASPSPPPRPPDAWRRRHGCPSIPAGAGCRSWRRRTTARRRCSARPRRACPWRRTPAPVTEEGCSSVFSLLPAPSNRCTSLPTEQASTGLSPAWAATCSTHLLPHAVERLHRPGRADAAECAIVAAGQEAAG